MACFEELECDSEELSLSTSSATFSCVQQATEYTEAPQTPSAVRSYKPFPPLLAQFCAKSGLKTKPSGFKKEYLRQGLARALHYMLKRQLQSYTERVKSPIAQALLSSPQYLESFTSTVTYYQESLTFFMFPKTLSRRGSQFEGRSLNDTQWKKFVGTPGIRPLLRVLMQFMFSDERVEVLSDRWGKVCCGGNEHGSECETKWKKLRAFLETECELEGVFTCEELLA